MDMDREWIGRYWNLIWNGWWMDRNWTWRWGVGGEVEKTEKLKINTAREGMRE
jgi:hypothetical protein